MGGCVCRMWGYAKEGVSEGWGGRAMQFLQEGREGLRVLVCSRGVGMSDQDALVTVEPG